MEDVTQFEAMTAAAYHELAAREVEVAVIEAGLGGRYDATNVIPSKLTVLTGVGLEHTRWLGPTIPDIADGEAGRACATTPTLVVPSDLDPEALEVADRVSWPSATRAWSPRRCPRGRSSGATSALAYVAAAEFLERAPEPAAVESAITRDAHPGPARGGGGRAAHRSTTAPTTPPAPRRWRQALPGVLGERRPVVLVASVLDDKDAAGMLARPAAAVRPRGVHALREPAGAVAGHAGVPRGEARRPAVGDRGRARAAAVARAREIAGPEGAVVATGSIYLIADLVRDGGAPASRL